MSRRTTLVVVAIIVGGALATSYLAYNLTARTSTITLPPGCVKPSGGFLIIADVNGYNDSVQHGVPHNSWPVINVQRGTTVKITVCNTDHQAHGFQILHYFASSIETVSPGQVFDVAFLADESGTFTIYCSIFCTIHTEMQSGELIVT